MGFSEDINHAQRVLYRYLERDRVPQPQWKDVEKGFLDGFEHGWKYIEQFGVVSPHLKWNEILVYLQEDFFARDKFGYQFGSALGKLNHFFKFLFKNSKVFFQASLVSFGA